MSNTQLSPEWQKRADERHARFMKAVNAGQVRPFPKEVFDALRPYQFGGIPMSILLFTIEMNNGFCYEKGTDLTLAFDECTLYYGDVEYLRVKTEGEIHKDGSSAADHAFVEAYGHVFDTTMGLMYTKEAYWDVERPTIRKTHTKEECLEYLKYSGILGGGTDFAKNKWSLLLTLPSIENIVYNTEDIATEMNKKLLLEEIKKLKIAIDYDGMQAEMVADMELMRTDPKALDEKFGIVKDKYGREISRGGVLNPYYEEIDPETIPERNAKFKEDMKDPVKEQEFISKIEAEHDAEMKLTYQRATLFLEKVKKNPTANIYEMSEDDIETTEV